MTAARVRAFEFSTDPGLSRTVDPLCRRRLARNINMWLIINRSAKKPPWPNIRTRECHFNLISSKYVRAGGFGHEETARLRTAPRENPQKPPCASAGVRRQHTQRTRGTGRSRRRYMQPAHQRKFRRDSSAEGGGSPTPHTHILYSDYTTLNKHIDRPRDRMAAASNCTCNAPRTGTWARDAEPHKQNEPGRARIRISGRSALCKCGTRAQPLWPRAPPPARRGLSWTLANGRVLQQQLLRRSRAL
ncbi:hypothetical protein C8Q76DRAFT_30510 [Earliella scabrosa]|nr:hypothetical protein C8Q76DRAFT_30510 [Earliella scabrosa]